MKDQPEHPADEQGEEEYLTTETDAGFRAVALALVGVDAVWMLCDDGWNLCHLNPAAALREVKSGVVYGIKNPAYQPEPEQPEPEVGQVWECCNGQEWWILDWNGHTYWCVRPDKRAGFHLARKDLVKYIRDIDLSALTGEEK